VSFPSRLFLDTNVFILGYLYPQGTEGRLLSTLRDLSSVTLVISNELIEEILRVARRVKSKDWAGYLVDRIWRDYTIEYVSISDEEKRHVLSSSSAPIPREDLGVYLTAVRGRVDCLISANRELIRQAAARQGLFECLTPEAFLDKYV
jgi:predicted nucleic acid-binding protein